MDPATLIVTCRIRAGLSQRGLAERAATSAAAVCLYERGARVPGVHTLARLVAATGSTLEFVAPPPADVDRVANGRGLEELLELADHLPQRSGRELAAPPFAQLADAAFRPA